MANNKIVLGNETLIDLTEDTATVESVLDGYTFHGADGVQRVGTAIAGGGDDKMDIDGSNADSAVTFANSAFTIGSRSSNYDLGTIHELNTNLTNSFLPREYRGGAASVVYNNKIHLLGADNYSQSSYYTDHYSMDESGEWHKENDLPCQFKAGTAVVYNNKIHILGGAYSPYKHYSWDGNSWFEEDDLPFEHSSIKICSVVYDNKIHILGGVDSDNFYNHYSWDGSTWISESTLPIPLSPYSNNNFAVVYNNKIHIFEGNGGSGRRHYSWDGTSWVSESTLPYDTSGTSYNCVVINNKIHMIGGDTNSSETAHYSWNGTSWSQESTLPYRQRMGIVIVYKNAIHIMGGGAIDSYHTISATLNGVSFTDTYISHCMYCFGIGWMALNRAPYNIGSFSAKHAVIYQNKIHILGFYNDHYAHCSWDGTTWYKESTLPIEISGSERSEVVVYNDKIYLIGGTSNSTNKSRWHSWDGTSWTRMSPNLPYPFTNGIAVIYNNKIHILSTNSNKTYFYYHYSWDGTSWVSESTLPALFMYGTAIVYNNAIHVFNVLYNSSGNQTTKGVHYSWDGNSWRSYSQLEKSKMNSSSIVYNDKIYLIGGNSNSDRISFLSITQEEIYIDKILPTQQTITTPMAIYKNYMYIFDSGGAYNIFRYKAYEGIINESNPTARTIVHGYQSMAKGQYSTAKGYNSIALGDYSMAGGMNSKAVDDMEYVLTGSNNKFDSSPFAFGVSLVNKVRYNNTSISDPIDVNYGGCSGTIISSNSDPQLHLRFKVPYAVYLFVYIAYNRASPVSIGRQKVYLISTGGLKSNGLFNIIGTLRLDYDGSSGTYFEAVWLNDYNIIKVENTSGSSNDWRSLQFTLIRLA